MFKEKNIIKENNFSFVFSPLSASLSFLFKRFVLLLVVMGMNFNAILMEIVFLTCGSVMGKKIVKMVVMKKAVMAPYDCVITKPSFPVGAQVSRTLPSASTVFSVVESF